MKPYYEEFGITIYHGDCREVLPLLGHFGAIITDPVWPDGKADIPGKEDPHVLLKSALAVASVERVVIHLGCQSDPRILTAVPQRFPFIRACWLDLARPHYNGLILAGSEVAYAFGKMPERRGWTVLPGMCRDANGDGKQADHPCPRKLHHVRWLCKFYAQGRTCDPFLGSGTTAVACKSLGIPFVGIEIDERYCERSSQRLAQAVFDFSEPPAVEQFPLVS